MDSTTDWRHWIGAVIVLAPPLGYGLAYVHELGYFDFYKIPMDFISLNWTTIFVAISASLGALFLLLWFVTALVLSKLENISAVRQKIYLVIMSFIFLFIIAIKYLTVEETKELGIFFAIFVAAIFVVPWFIRNYGDIPISRFKRGGEPPKSATATYVKKILDSKYLKYSFLTIYVLIFIFAFSYLDGRSTGIDRQVFYVPSSNPQLVVLKISGDSLICAPIIYRGKDSKGQDICIVRQEFFVLKSSENALSIKATRLGYVRVSESP